MMSKENGPIVNGNAAVPKAAPSRIAQISKTLISVPFMGEKKKGAVQKRPAPVLPSEARAAAVDKPQDLNLYASRMAKGEVWPH